MQRPPAPPQHIGKKRCTKPLKRLINPFRRAVVAWIDSPWSQYTALKTHVVICGFPRSGTTLLQLMAQSCVRDLKCFPREVRGLEAAQCAARNHPTMLTKRPNDIFLIDEIRDYYSRKNAEVRFVVVRRDPRDVLTSIHALRPNEFYVSPERWRAIHEHWEWTLQHKDTVHLDYRELVCQPDHVQRKLTDVIGWEVSHPFSEYFSLISPEFDTTALNSVRPPDASNLNRWRSPKYHQRVRDLLRELPDLPQRLIEMGYESDTEWVNEYTQSPLKQAG